MILHFTLPLMREKYWEHRYWEHRLELFGLLWCNENVIQLVCTEEILNSTSKCFLRNTPQLDKEKFILQQKRQFFTCLIENTHCLHMLSILCSTCKYRDREREEIDFNSYNKTIQNCILLLLFICIHTFSIINSPLVCVINIVLIVISHTMYKFCSAK